MQIATINKMTLLDYPNHLSAIIFTASCNLRCHYCHNANFVLPHNIANLAPHFIPFSVVKKFLQTRQGFLDGVVFSGGEPTLQTDLVQCISEVKQMGFLVKLDTNGLNYSVINHLITNKLIDYIAVDLKAPLDKYQEITGVKINPKTLKQTIQLVINSSIEYEFRSTILPKYHQLNDLELMAKEILGAKKWAWQNFRNNSVLNSSLSKERGFTYDELINLQTNISHFNIPIEIRN